MENKLLETLADLRATCVSHLQGERKGDGPYVRGGALYLRGKQCQFLNNAESLLSSVLDMLIIILKILMKLKTKNIEKRHDKGYRVLSPAVAVCQKYPNFKKIGVGYVNRSYM